MLPDLTITALPAASLILASSAALKPVVPMMCTLPVCAASAAKATVAAGTVKSTMPSAFAISGAASLVSLMPFSPIPASTPASWPISGEPAPSSAPSQRQILVLGDRLHQRAPHAPAGPGNDQTHFGH